MSMSGVKTCAVTQETISGPSPNVDSIALLERVAGVKRALTFDIGCDEVPNKKQFVPSLPKSKKNDCVCTCCHNTGLQRNKCVIFRLGKYDNTHPEVEKALAQRYRDAKNKELICKICDVKLLQFYTHNVSQQAEHPVADDLPEKSYVSSVRATLSSADTSLPEVVYICTCCRLENSARRKYLLFRNSKYDSTNSNVAKALEYRYCVPGQKEYICRTCHALMLKGALPQNALSSPARDRPQPNTKCIICYSFHNKKMRIFNRTAYGRNSVLDVILCDTEISDRSIICSPCHTKYLNTSLISCVQCGSNVMKKRSVLLNCNKFHQHNRIVVCQSSVVCAGARLCMLCHKGVVGEKANCAVCRRSRSLRNMLLFDELNYDLSQYIVANIINTVRTGMDAKSTICQQCHTSLITSSDEVPNVPAKLNNPLLKSASDFLKALNDLPSYACTCCHRLLFKKTVKPFMLHDYDQDNPIVKECLSHRITLRMDDVDDISKLFSAEKNMMNSGYADHLCIGDITIPEYICIRCKNALLGKEPVMPDQACANGLKLYAIPDELSSMFPIERRVISFRIPFITLIVIRRYGGHYKVNGPPVNVPTTLDQIVKILPRMPNQLQLHPLKLKRKLEYKSYYMYDMVRKDKVVSAILWLKENNKHYRDVTIDTSWMDMSALNDIDLFQENSNTSLVHTTHDQAVCDQVSKMHQINATLNTKETEVVQDNEQSLWENGDTQNEKNGNSVEPNTETSAEVDAEFPVEPNNEISTVDDIELREDQAAIDHRQEITGDPLPSVVQFDSLENVIYNCAPGENNIPRYILLDDDFEVLAFPDLFPYGYGGYNSRPIRCRLPIRKYFQQRLLNVDGRFSKNLEYIFCAQYISDIQQIQSDANLAIRLSRGRTLNGQNITAGVLRDPAALQQLIRTEQAYKFLKNVRGSPSYWQGELYDVLAMLKSLGIPTWFLTLSAADLHWPEMIQAIGSQYGMRLKRDMIIDMSVADKSFFLRQNPVTGVRMFQHRVESFFSNYLLSCANPIGCITDYVIKIEFQMRGSPHAHCLIWVKDAPKLDREDDVTVCTFIDKYISATLPATSPRYKRSRDMMLRLQQHTHSDYCRRNKRCRFGFPKPPSFKTVICRRPEGEQCEDIIQIAKVILKKVHDELHENGTVHAKNDINALLSACGVSPSTYSDSLKITPKGPTVILQRNPCDANINSCNIDILNLWGANVDLQYVVNEVATVMYVCSYMTKGEKAMGETLKRVAKECMHDDMRTQMNKIKKEFLGKRVIGAPESCMRVLSSWLMKKSRKVIYVNSNMKGERVSLPKTKAQLARLDPDDDDVFATSLIDRYGSRPYDLENVCLAEFAVNYDVAQKGKKRTNDSDQSSGSACVGRKIKLRNELGYMQKRKTPSILRTRKFKVAVEPERYYHSKLILYYPWFNEDTLIDGFASYQLSYEDKQGTIIANAQLFNDDCEAFDIDIDAVDGYNDSMWDLVAPSLAEDDSLTAKLGFATVQEHSEKECEISTTPSSSGLPSDTLSKLYLQAADKQELPFKTYCEFVYNLNKKQKEIVMFNRSWCKAYIHKFRLGQKVDGYRVFLSGCGGTGKSHVVRLIQRDMSYLLHHVLHPEPDQPIVLVTAPTGSAAYNIGGSTVHSALCINDRSRGTVSYERKCMMQVKLEHLMLLVTDEISMVGFDFFQRMNQTVTSIKGLTGGNWGNICVLTVGDLFQLPPVASAPIYVPPRNVNSLNDLAPNGWEQFKLHELDEVMRQKDMEFVDALNNIRIKQPESCSHEDVMLKGRELFLSRDNENYPHDAMHVYAQNVYCDEWNEYMLDRLPGPMVSNIATDSRKDISTNLANVSFSDKPRDTGNLRHVLRLKVGAKVMLTTNVDVSDGLTNGSMGVVSKILFDGSTNKMKTVLVRFEDDRVGVHARNGSTYKGVDPHAVPINKGQATFTVNGRKSCNASRTQFPLTLSWAVTIHKCQGLTLPEVVVDMSPEKGKFSSGQAYVAFSRVRSLDKLHIINYTRSQIRISPSAEDEMLRLRECPLEFVDSKIPGLKKAALALLHINICTLLNKLPYILQDKLFQSADIISLNETHLLKNVKLLPSMLGLKEEYCVFRHDRDKLGGGIALVIKSSLLPTKINICSRIEVVAVHITLPEPATVISVYRPPTTPIPWFARQLTEILSDIKGTNVLVVGDFNEDILLSENKPCCMQMKSLGLKQWVHKPTRDSGSLIDHLYTSANITTVCDVLDCYYSDHDFVVCSLSFLDVQ